MWHNCQKCTNTSCNAQKWRQKKFINWVWFKGTNNITKKLYPEIIENNQLGYSYSDIVFIRSFSYSAVSSATTSRANSYSSGGGGFSSSGGGGGSFGGGGSIGSR